MANNYVAESISDLTDSAFRLDKATGLTRSLLQYIDDDEDDDIEIDKSVYVPERKKTDLDKLQDDFEFARENLKKALVLNSEKIAEYAEFVSGTDSPRAFEVFSKMMDTTSSLSQDLVNLHSLKNKVVPQEVNIIQNQQNNVVALTPMEAIKMIKQKDNIADD